MRYLTLLLPLLLALSPAHAEDPGPTVEPVEVVAEEPAPVEARPEVAAAPVPAEVEAIAADMADGGADLADSIAAVIDTASHLTPLGAVAFLLSLLLAVARRSGLDKLLPTSAYPYVMAVLGLLAGVLGALATGEPWLPALLSGLSSGVLGVLLYDRLLEPVYRALGLVQTTSG